MRVMAKTFCRFDLVRYINERIFENPAESIVTVSLTEKNSKELMIFFRKNSKTLEYEVVVYKHRKSDHYIASPYDKIKRVEEKSVATTFYFDSFKNAIYFLQYFGFYHKEYQLRPSAKLMAY